VFDLFTNWLEPVSYFLYLIAVLMYYSGKRTHRIRILIYYYLLATILMTVASSYVRYNRPNGAYYNVLMLVSLVTIGLYFDKILIARLPRLLIRYVIAAGIVYFLVRSIGFRKLDDFDSTGYSVVTVAVVALSFVYFHQVLRHVNERKITHSIDFWIVAGWLLYYLGRFFTFQTYEYLTNKIMHTYTHEERRIMTLVWAVPNVFLFVGALLLLAGTLWISYRLKYRS
jgi:hypothetical protein